MRSYSVISKGEYVHKQTSEFLHISKYIIVRRGAKRQLLLNFENLSRDKLTAIKLQIDQYDARGKFLGVVNVDVNGVEYKTGKFVLKKEIILNGACLDAFVKIVVAEYGDYQYRLGDNDTYSVFDKKVEKKALTKESLKEELGKETHKADTRRFGAPIFVRIFSVIAIFVALITAYVHLSMFTNGKTDFFIDNVKYEFVDGVASDDGDVRVIGYAGFGGTQIVIPDEIEGHPVVEVSSGAFMGNKTLTSVEINGNVEIKKDAFRACTSLKKLVVNGVSKIGEGAFRSCNSLTDVEIKIADEIGDEAFRFCSNLKTIKISADLPTRELVIGARAFSEWGNVDEITINQFVKYDTTKAYFYGIDSVAKLSLKNYNYTPYEIEPIDVDKPIDQLFDFPGFINLKELHIEYTDNLTSNLLKGNANTIKSITIDNMDGTVIEDEMFKGFVYLETFSIPKITEVGNGAFWGTALKSFDAKNLTHIGEGAFMGCFALKEFDLKGNDKIESIGTGAFEGTTSLESIYIPKSVTSLGESVFRSSGVKSVEFSEENLLTEIPISTFSGCTALTDVKFSSHVVRIDDYAFGACSSLKEIKLPETLTEIGNNVFVGCTSLSTLVIPDTVTSIGMTTLMGCSSLKELTIPYLGKNRGSGGALGYLFTTNQYYMQANAVPSSLKTLTITKDTTVGSGAFYGLENLTEINLSEDTIAIYSESFYMCMGLRYIRIPSNVSYLSPSAFSECYRLFEVENDSALTIERGSGAGEFALAVYGVSNPDKPLKHKDEANGLTYLYADSQWYLINTEKTGDVSISQKIDGKKVIIPSLLFYKTQIDNLTLGESIAHADDMAFALSQIANVKTNKASFTMGEYLFAQSDALKTVDLSGAEFSALNNGTFYNCSELKSVTLPSMVMTFGEDVFADCQYLSSVTIPTSLRKVGDRAFRNCYSIQKIDFTKALVLNEIGESAVEGCTALTEVSLPTSLRIVGKNAFLKCYSLKSLEIPSQVTSLGEDIVKGCSALTSLSVPFFGQTKNEEAVLGRLFDYTYSNHTSLPWMLKTITVTASPVIADHAFDSCGYVTTIKLPENTSTIGAYAFRGCYSLKTINMPSGLGYIGDYAFANCGEIESITLPYGLYSIGSYAFNGCYSLTKINFPETIYSIGSYAFSHLPISGKLNFGAELRYIYDYAFTGTQISELSLPSSLRSIGYGAFASCYNLESVTIKCSASCSVASNAFEYSRYIHEVYDIGRIGLWPGASSFGGVANYAVVVRNNATAPKLEKAIVDGMTFKYANDICALVDASNVYDPVVKLEKVSLGGSSRSYIISKYAFSNYISKLIITDAVTEIKPYAFRDVYSISTVVFDGAKISVPAYAFRSVSRLVYDDNLKSIESSAFSSLNYVYYKGSASNWENNPNKGNLSYYSPSYYWADCFHTSGRYWNYNSAGEINTIAKQYDQRVVKQPTCENTGIREYYCDVCDYLKQETISAIGHSYSSYYVCTTCNKILPTYINRSNYSLVNGRIFTITNDSENPFNVFSGTYSSRISSAIEGKGTTKLKIKAERDFTLSLYLRFSTTTRLGTVTIDAPSGKTTYTSNMSELSHYTLRKGDVVTITFNKTSDGTGYIYFDNVGIA